MDVLIHLFLNVNDFILILFNVTKTDFCFCMGLLPAYIEKIEELAISEEDTPGQVFAFLHFFPSFAVFKRLRTLHLHINGETADSKIFSALLSLAHTSITTLSIKSINTTKIRAMDIVILRIFNLKSLKRFSFIADSYVTDWSHLFCAPSNIKHLTISGLNCGLQHIPYICQSLPHLKYLDVEISNAAHLDHYESIQDTKKYIKFTYQLHTLLLSFQRNNRTTLYTLAAYLMFTPVLKRLEIKAYNKFIDANEWESMLKSSLPLLNHFSLQIAAFDSQSFDLDNVLASFQTPFWIAKKNFNIMLTEYQQLSFDLMQLKSMSRYEQSKFDLQVFKCRIAPDRTVNKLPSLKLSDMYSTVSSHYYFDNVKCLDVDNINRTLLEWVTTYVNCSRITELTITGSSNNMPTLTSLIACIPNINSLHIRFDQLTGNKDAFLGKHNTLKRLDISPSMHTFSEQDIIFIGKFFPHLEHLQVNTSDLYSVPVLGAYLPHLRSLTFKVSEYIISLLTDYTRTTWVYDLRRKTKFLFEHKDDSITVWIDQDAFEDCYWQTFPVQSSKSSATTTASDNSKKKKRIFSFFKFFK